jgi:hypothetical protein
MWYHVGSRNEKRGKTGFAHMFEHFFFNGSENYPYGFREAMDDLGANNRNGTTNTDRTNFFEDVPVSALERTLYLEADRMGFLGNYINKDMLERERGVVQNEKRQGENQPYGRVWSERTQRMYPYSHPYSWPVIGYMEDLQAASLEGVVPHLLRPEQCGDFPVRRHHAGTRAGAGEEVLRRHPRRPGPGADREMGAGPGPQHPRHHGRPGAASAHLPQLPHPRLGRRR